MDAAQIAELKSRRVEGEQRRLYWGNHPDLWLDASPAVRGVIHDPLAAALDHIADRPKVNFQVMFAR